MGSRYLLDLADVMRRTGFPVIEVDGWQYAARSSGGYNSGAPNHIMAHHTASPKSSDGWNDVIYITENAEYAPLSNLYLSRTGTIYVCAGGATNTNGSGNDPCGKLSPDSMNSNAVGIEAANDGVGEVWPQIQLDAYIAMCRELQAAYGIDVEQLHAHWEYAPSRKIDPAGPPRPMGGGPNASSWNMDEFRDDVDGQLPPIPTPIPPTPIPTPNPPTTEDDPMRILILEDAGNAAVLLTGHVATWLDPGRYTAFHNAYPIVDEPAAVSWLANCVVTGPLPDGVRENQVWDHLP